MARKRIAENPKYMAILRYRRRFRTWTMEAMPDMPHDQWNKLVAWVMAWGAEYHGRLPEAELADKRFRRDVDIFRETGPVYADRDAGRYVIGPVTGAARQRNGRTPTIIFNAEKETT